MPFGRVGGTPAIAPLDTAATRYGRRKAPGSYGRHRTRPSRAAGPAHRRRGHLPDQIRARGAAVAVDGVEVLTATVSRTAEPMSGSLRPVARPSSRTSGPAPRRHRTRIPTGPCTVVNLDPNLRMARLFRKDERSDDRTRRSAPPDPHRGAPSAASVGPRRAHRDVHGRPSGYRCDRHPLCTRQDRAQCVRRPLCLPGHLRSRTLGGSHPHARQTRPAGHR